MRGRQSHPRAEGSDYAKSLNSSAWQLLGRFNASNAKGSQVILRQPQEVFEPWPNVLFPARGALPLAIGDLQLHVQL